MSAVTVSDLQAARRRSASLWREVSCLREQLTARIGPRGLRLGTLVTPDGAAAQMHVGSPNKCKKLWKRLPAEIRGDKLATLAAVRSACGAWDKEAERIGLLALQAQAEAARDRFRALLRAWSEQDDDEPVLTVDADAWNEADIPPRWVAVKTSLTDAYEGLARDHEAAGDTVAVTALRDASRQVRRFIQSGDIACLDPAVIREARTLLAASDIPGGWQHEGRVTGSGKR